LNYLSQSVIDLLDGLGTAGIFENNIDSFDDFKTKVDL
jgi:hypothetical protein